MDKRGTGSTNSGPGACSERGPFVARAGIVILVGLAFLMPTHLAVRKSVTSDEVAHIPAGYSYLVTREVVLNPMHPPLIKEICALPLLFLNVVMPADASSIRSYGRNVLYQWKFGDDFFLAQDMPRILAWSRVPAAMLSAGLAAVIAVWAADLWGPFGGVLASALYVFDPTVTAHAQFVTTDVGFAFFATLYFYWLRALLRDPSWTKTWRAGFALSLALGSKFPALLLVPISVLLVVLGWWEIEPRIADGSPVPKAPFHLARSTARADRMLAALIVFTVVGVCAYGLLWAMYFFPSDPAFYWNGVKALRGDFNPAYRWFFMGEFHKSGDGWLAYFAVAWLIKTPIPEIVLLAVAFAYFFRGVRASWLDEAFLLIPPVVLFSAYSLSAAPLGVRYVIPCFPFLLISTGRLARCVSRSDYALSALVAVALIGQVTEFARIWPDHLSYFNELVGGWRGGVRWLDDSNVDWGQNFVELRDYLDAHPRRDVRLCNFVTELNAKYYRIPGQLVSSDDALRPPAAGTWILSSHCVARVMARLNAVYGDQPGNWIAHTEPTAIVGHTFWIFDIPAH